MRTLAWILVALPVLLLAFAGIRFMFRGTPIRRVRTAPLHEARSSVTDAEFSRTLELLSGVRLEPGNEVELLCCGDETYPRMLADLASAERSITLQMYYCKPGRLADRLHDVLCDRARAGVRVLFLWDAFGSQDLPDEYRDSLREAGVDVAVFRPIRWWALESVYTRSHIRVVVVDARVGYTGGFGIDDKWLGDGRHADQWRDTNVRFTGPAVHGLQATFAAGWAEATGDLLTGEPFFDGADAAPYGSQPGEDVEHRVTAGVMHAEPSVGSTAAERFLVLAIGGARRSLYLTNSYFVPGDSFTGLLARAAERGVDVRILTAGPNTDVRSTRMAGRSYYERLLRGGVRIWEYSPTMIHAKTVVVDGCLGSVGTMNFDNRSMAFNDESNFVFLDGGVGRALHEVFEEDLEYSREVTLEEFLRRPWTERVQERLFGALTRIL
ncbi:MAG TPA: phospholipase D-like domain-containing protein [Gemmatimonadales bacterium]